MNGWINEWMNKYTNEWMNKWMVGKLMGEWIAKGEYTSCRYTIYILSKDKWMNVMDEWIDGWIGLVLTVELDCIKFNGWKYKHIYVYVCVGEYCEHN